MTVTVCIPAYNAARFLGEAIESALAQTYAAREIVVVDDGSTDATADVARRYDRVRLVAHGRNRGQGEALNTGIREARGELVKFLSADDVLFPHCLERMAPLFEHERVGLVFARRQIRVEGGSEEWAERYRNVHAGFGELREINPGRELFERWRATGFRDNWVGEPSSVMMRRSVFDEVGLFNPHIAGALDMDMWARALARYDVGFVDEELSAYRVHGGSLTARVHGRPRVSLDRAWLLHGLGLRELRHEAELRVAKDWLRFPQRVPSLAAYVQSRLATARSDVPAGQNRRSRTDAEPSR